MGFELPRASDESGDIVFASPVLLRTYQKNSQQLVSVWLMTMD
jgi:hypothetical protein